MMLRPRYRAEKLPSGEWVATDGLSLLYEYAGPSKRAAENAASAANTLLAMHARNEEEIAHFIGRKVPQMGAKSSDT